MRFPVHNIPRILYQRRKIFARCSFDKYCEHYGAGCLADSRERMIPDVWCNEGKTGKQGIWGPICAKPPIPLARNLAVCLLVGETPSPFRRRGSALTLPADAESAFSPLCLLTPHRPLCYRCVAPTCRCAAQLRDFCEIAFGTAIAVPVFVPVACRAPVSFRESAQHSPLQSPAPAFPPAPRGSPRRPLFSFSETQHTPLATP